MVLPFVCERSWVEETGVLRILTRPCWFVDLSIQYPSCFESFFLAILCPARAQFFKIERIGIFLLRWSSANGRS